MNRLFSIVLLFLGVLSLGYGLVMTGMDRDNDETLLFLGFGAVAVLLSAALHSAQKTTG